MWSGWAKTLNLQAGASFSPDKHTCRCLLHVHTAPARPVPTFTCNIHSTVTGRLTQVTIYTTAQDIGLTVGIISDTGGTYVPRWGEKSQWTNELLLFTHPWISRYWEPPKIQGVSIKEFLICWRDTTYTSINTQHKVGSFSYFIIY